MTAVERGALGEQYCVEILKARGYRILCRNYRIRRGEIDVIASRGDTLAFIEVKTRAANSLGTPAEAVGAQKQRRLIAAAQHYLLRYPVELWLRFDVFEVVVADAKEFVVQSHRHIEGAFDVNETNRID